MNELEQSARELMDYLDRNHSFYFEGNPKYVKKLLCAGQRDKGSKKEDLIGALAALNRAIELENTRSQ